MTDMFAELDRMNRRPKPFEFYTTKDLWTDEYTSQKMLAFHLDETCDMSSRNGAFIDASAAWIASRFRIGPRTDIADFGCGPGLYTTRLARKGARVTGIDFSPRSIAYARETAAKEGLDIRYINENYLDFETESRFDLIVMIMCDFCALGPDRRRTMLSKFRKLLKPSGAVLLDAYSLAAFGERKEAAVFERNLLDGFWSPEPYYGFLHTFRYDDVRVVLDRYTIFEPSRTHTVYNWLQYFAPEDLEREFAACGLTVTERYADVAGTLYDPQANEFAVVARRS
jgi:SAM-dependent methyltransferase